MNKTKLVSVACALMGLGSYSLLEAAPVNDVKLKHYLRIKITK